MQEFNLFDLVVLVVTVLLGLKGLFNGLIKEAFGLIGIIGGIYVASRLASTVGRTLAPSIGINNSASISLMGFIISLAVFWVLAYVVGTIISKLTSLSGLGIFDRLLGFLFGMGKIFCILAVIIYALSRISAINTKIESLVGTSIAYPLLLQTGNYIVKLKEVPLAIEAKKAVSSTIDAAKKNLKDVNSKNIEKQVQGIKKTLEEKAAEQAVDQILSKKDKSSSKNANTPTNNQEENNNNIN